MITVMVGQHNRPGSAACGEMPEQYGAVSSSPTGSQAKPDRGQ